MLHVLNVVSKGLWCNCKGLLMDGGARLVPIISTHVMHAVARRLVPLHWHALQPWAAVHATDRWLEERIAPRHLPPPLARCGRLRRREHLLQLLKEQRVARPRRRMEGGVLEGGTRWAQGREQERRVKVERRDFSDSHGHLRNWWTSANGAPVHTVANGTSAASQSRDTFGYSGA